MIRFEDLIEKVRSTNPDADIELLRRAYVFSAFEHKGQVRHSGEPYLVHPLEVADREELRPRRPHRADLDHVRAHLDPERAQVHLR
jgi:hypothetical protein